VQGMEEAEFCSWLGGLKAVSFIQQAKSGHTASQSAACNPKFPCPPSDKHCVAQLGSQRLRSHEQKSSLFISIPNETEKRLRQRCSAISNGSLQIQVSKDLTLYSKRY
jgi:hypothetical protein